VLKETYRRTPDISRSGQAVTISFTDFKVDVVPSFYRHGGGFFTSNTSGGTWIATDPRKHIALSSRQNAAHGNDLVPLIKILKCWNRTIGRRVRSFHLEVLAWQIFDRMTISNFSSGARYFFDKGRGLISKHNSDPAGFGGDVGFYINTRVQLDDAISRFATAYNRAVKAEDYARRGYVAEAITEWRKVFGETFPAHR
jgi:hypothetical protein